MNIKYALFIVLIAASSVANAQSNEGDYYIATVNGIATNAIQASKMHGLTKALVGNQFQIGSDVRSINYLKMPNPTEGGFSDLIETTDQFLRQPEAQDSGFIWSTVVKNHLLGAFSDELFPAFVRNEDVITNHVETYKELIEQGHSILIIAHSQGNFYTNEVIRRVKAELPAQTAGLNRITAYHVATPANETAENILGDSTNYYLTNHNDIILNVPESLDSNVDIFELNVGSLADRWWDKQWVLDFYPFLSSVSSFNNYIDKAVDAFASYKAHDYVDVYANVTLNTGEELVDGINASLGRLKFPEENEPLVAACNVEKIPVNGSIELDLTKSQGRGGYNALLGLVTTNVPTDFKFDPMSGIQEAIDVVGGQVLEQHEDIGSAMRTPGFRLTLCTDGESISGTDFYEVNERFPSAVNPIFDETSRTIYDPETKSGSILETSYQEQIITHSVNGNLISSRTVISNLEADFTIEGDIISITEFGACTSDVGNNNRVFNSGDVFYEYISNRKVVAADSFDFWDSILVFGSTGLTGGFSVPGVTSGSNSVGNFEKSFVCN